jgi:hypothetical protein
MFYSELLAWSYEIIERLNHILFAMLNVYDKGNQNNWDVLIPYVVYAYRTAVHLTKESQVLPFDMLLKQQKKLLHVDTRAQLMAQRYYIISSIEIERVYLVTFWSPEVRKEIVKLLQ